MEVEIPGIGRVAFSDDLTTDEIAARAQRISLQGQMASARRTGAAAETAANVMAWGDFFLRPFASTAEHPLGAFQTALEPVGQVVNDAGEAAKEMYRTTVAGYGGSTGRIDEGVVGAIPPVLASIYAPELLGETVPLAGKPPIGFGVIPAAQTQAQGGDIGQVVKAGAVGALIPGTAQ